MIVIAVYTAKHHCLIIRSFDLPLSPLLCPCRIKSAEKFGDGNSLLVPKGALSASPKLRSLSSRKARFGPYQRSSFGAEMTSRVPERTWVYRDLGVFAFFCIFFLDTCLGPIYIPATRSSVAPGPLSRMARSTRGKREIRLASPTSSQIA